MNTSFKKVMAGVTAVTIVAMNMTYLTVNAASYNTASAAASAGQIVVTGLWFSGASPTCSARITRTNNDGTTTTTTVDSCTITNDTTLTIAASTVTTSEYYTIAFSANGTYGTTATGNTTNAVTVTATVLPVLSMSITNPTIVMGDLSITANTQAATTSVVTVNSNANSFAVKANIAGTDSVAPRTNMLVRTADNNDTDAQINFGLNTDGSSTIAIQDNQNVITQGAFSATPVAATVRYVAGSAASKKDGNYTTTVTYTVTGTF